MILGAAVLVVVAVAAFYVTQSGNSVSIQASGTPTRYTREIRQMLNRNCVAQQTIGRKLKAQRSWTVARMAMGIDFRQIHLRAQPEEATDFRH